MPGVFSQFCLVQIAQISSYSFFSRAQQQQQQPAGASSTIKSRLVKSWCQNYGLQLAPGPRAGAGSRRGRRDAAPDVAMVGGTRGC